MSYKKQPLILGTPKTMDEAISLMICFRDKEKSIQDQCYDVLRDFLGQKFCVAYMRMSTWREGSSTQYSPEEILEELFDSLTKREG